MRNLSGERFGKWYVLDYPVQVSGRDRKWLCRCECGTERYVLERSLLYGGSLSCGCLKKEMASQSNSLKIAGQTFGELKVLYIAERQRKNGGIWWTCRCSCGNLCDAPATVLASGKKTNCGGPKHPKQYAYTDISGQRFNRLVAISPTKKRTAKGGVLWHCRCDCGNEVDIAYNWLVYSHIRSCGCQKKERESHLYDLLTFVDGTSIDAIKSKKVRADNTTGAKGVYFYRGKYIAKIVFQKKQYYLGKYNTFSDAVKARTEAEAALFDEVASYYDKWKKRADMDSQWAQENPVKIQVSRGDAGEIKVVFLPILDMRFE